MVIDPTVANLAQWILSQGIGVAVAIAVLWLVGRKVDQQNVILVDLRIAVQALIDSKWSTK